VFVRGVDPDATCGGGWDRLRDIEDLRNVPPASDVFEDVLIDDVAGSEQGQNLRTVVGAEVQNGRVCESAGDGRAERLSAELHPEPPSVRDGFVAGSVPAEDRQSVDVAVLGLWHRYDPPQDLSAMSLLFFGWMLSYIDIRMSLEDMAGPLRCTCNSVQLAALCQVCFTRVISKGGGSMDHGLRHGDTVVHAYLGVCIFLTMQGKAAMVRCVGTGRVWLVSLGDLS